VRRYREGWDMVVGARAGRRAQSSSLRWLGNAFYNRYASILTGQSISDLTSGFRVVSRSKFMEVLHLLPNGFSYPTTSTIALIRLGYSVDFSNVTVKPAEKGSHIRLFTDGVRFFVIIFKVTILFSPFKALIPVSMASIFLGLILYLETYFTGVARFTNGMAMLLSSGVFTFAVALLAEQMTMLLYTDRNR